MSANTARLLDVNSRRQGRCSTVRASSSRVEVDTLERLDAWDATEPIKSDVAINTADVSPTEAASVINLPLRGMPPGSRVPPAKV